MKHLDEGILQAWLDRPRSGLSAAEEVEIEGHLAVCGSCARRLEALEGSSRHVEGLLSEPAAASSAGTIPPWEAVRARARQHRSADRRRSAWTAAAWAASVTVALGVGWMANDLSRGGGVPGGTEAARSAAGPTGAPSSAETPSAAEAPSAAETRAADASPSSDTPTGIARPASPVLAQAPVGPLPGRTRADSASPVLAQAPVPAPREEGRGDAARPGVVEAEAPVVRGRVTDEAGNPLKAAQVVAEGTGVGTLTGDDGTFELRLQAPPMDSALRQLTLTAQLIGYRGASQALSVGGSDVLSSDFRLRERSITLDELVVTGAPAVRDTAEGRVLTRSRAVAEGRSAAEPAPEALDMLRERRVPLHALVPSDVSAWMSWTAVDRARAEAAAGFRLLTVPELRVVRMEVGSALGRTWVRIIQELADGGTLELVETGPDGSLEPAGTGAEPPRADVPPGSSPATGSPSRASMRRGGVLIVATAPLSGDALQALLQRLR